MQINRLFEIVYVLLDCKTMTAQDLAERFEVSTRTIYRDIETLSACGIPVYMQKGRGGGISILPEFILNKTILTDNEKEEILSSLVALNSVNLIETNTAIKKLSSLFGKCNSDWIEIDFSSWANPEQEKNLFIALKDAILSKNIIKFEYSSAKGERTHRKVEPLKLCYKSGAWYLYGYCKIRQDYRFFKLSRVKNLILTEETGNLLAPKTVFESKKIFEDDFFILKLKISQKLAYRVFDEFDKYEQQEDGSFIAQIKFPKGNWIYYYIATYGSECEVLEPLEIRNQVKNQLQETIKLYT